MNRTFKTRGKQQRDIGFEGSTIKPRDIDGGPCKAGCMQLCFKLKLHSEFADKHLARQKVSNSRQAGLDKLTQAG